MNNAHLYGNKMKQTTERVIQDAISICRNTQRSAKIAGVISKTFQSVNVRVDRVGQSVYKSIDLEIVKLKGEL